MKNKLKDIATKFDDLPIRIRLLITFGCAMLLFLLFDLFWYSSNAKAINQLSASNNTIDQQIAELIQSQNEINAGIYNQKNDPKRKQLVLLEKQILSAQKELENRAISLVKPELMPQLLKSIITNSKRLTLVSIIKQTPIPLFETENDQQNKIQMYQHPIELTFTGEYSETQKFLHKLENMEQKVTFESLNYTVDNYPKSKVTLVLSTLNLSRKWIGG
ncbi:hypothetical protein [Aliikangiella sp. IMCC44359]|uniref:hypothetical protein n=1 Tax=Aliikangiella sp. IMCC44359 TaxID=3459125 RepID=UPI00403B2857